MEKKIKISFHADWKNVQKLINVQGQIRSCRVEVGPKLNKVCSTFIRHTRVMYFDGKGPYPCKTLHKFSIMTVQSFDTLNYKSSRSEILRNSWKMSSFFHKLNKNHGILSLLIACYLRVFYVVQCCLSNERAKSCKLTDNY